MSKPHAATPPDDPANPSEQNPPFRTHSEEDVNKLEQELRKLGIKGDRQFPGILELIAEFEMRAYERGVLDGHVRQHDKDMLEMEPEAYERGRRDERMDCLTVAKWWIEWDGRPKHLLNDLAEDDKTTLDHIPELEKGKPE